LNPSKAAPRIVIKHLAGRQAHRVEQFELDGTHELVVGRHPGANIVFDDALDDTVSRRHALIRVRRDGRMRFTIADLGSTNGVRVNGKGITGERELMPGDIVELAPDGPAFSIAIEPESVPPDGAVPTRSRARPVIYGTAVAAFGIVLGALFYEYAGVAAIRPPASGQMVAIAASPPASSPAAEAAAVSEPPDRAKDVPQDVPKHSTSPAEATLYLAARWRLFDGFTGKPVFQKVLTRRGQRLPCFVELANHQIVPWLTTEDEEHTNIPIGGSVSGSGFIVSERGSIVTNKHIAAAWTMRYRGADWAGRAALFKAQTDPAREAPSTLIDLGQPDGEAARLTAWIPGNGGLLFRARTPVQIGPSPSRLEGRNEALKVRFPTGSVDLPARLARVSDKADLAELKIDSDRPLPALDLASDTEATIGEPVTALGYSVAGQAGVPGADGMGDPAEGPPPTLTAADTTISGLDKTAGSQTGLFELSAAAGAGADGGPVFAADGKVLAVVASGTTGKTYAYPAKLVRSLLDRQ